MDNTSGVLTTTSFNTRQIVEQYREVRAMMMETVLTLLRSFEISGNSTNSAEDSVLRGHERDAAIALTALERAGKSVMDLSPSGRSKDMEDFWVAIGQHSIAKGSQLVCYEDYKKYIVEPFMRQLRNFSGQQGDTGVEKDNAQGSRPFEWQEPLTCAMILSLLNRYNSSTTYPHVYAKAVDSVLSSLTSSYPPHYMFGGASLNKKEPHAFVSYCYLRSLRDTVETLRRREKEHRSMAFLLNEIQSWVEDANSRMRLSYSTGTDLKDIHIEPALSAIPNAAGLEKLIRALREFDFNGCRHPDDLKALASSCVQALEEELAPNSWLNELDKIIKEEILGSETTKGLDKEIADRASQLKASLFRASQKGIEPHKDEAGAMEIQIARGYVSVSGLCWKKAFFAGMLQASEEVRQAYQSLRTGGSPELGSAVDAANHNAAARPGRSGHGPRQATAASALAKAALAWSRSAQITENYIARLSKWAEAELYRQLSLDAARFKINFDPLQLAFALNIYSTESKEQNGDLIRKGLEILFQCQSKEGLWSVGAPLDLVRQVRSAVLVASIEVINAVIPLLKRYKEVEHHAHALYAIFTWLKTNRREISVPFVDRKKNSHIVRVIGWSGDKLAADESVDAWMCASVLQFLYEYNLVLQEMINRQSLEGYNVSEPGKLKWSELIDPQLGKPSRKRITTVVREQYIEPFLQKGASSHSSMILYGPPGTAKTTLAKALAAELNWKLVTITPSDLVKQGIEQSERMARELFENLRQIREVVVLFDEIDEMLRDRSDKEHDKQGIGILRFLIPGMLPKLQELKEHGEEARIIFIIATNYFDRLDPAIRRRGRIDEYFLVPPPDFKARCCQLEEMLQSKSPSCERATVNYYRQLAECLAAKTAGWVRKDWENVVEQALKDTELRRKIEIEHTPYSHQMRTDFHLNICQLKRKCGDFEWTDFEILRESEAEPGFVRALNPWAFYAGRAGAKEELNTIMKICWPGEWEQDERRKALEEFGQRILASSDEPVSLDKDELIRPKHPESGG